MTRTSIIRKLMAVAGCAALIVAADVGVSHAANNATAVTNGTVVVPIAITKQVDLEFGRFLAGAGAVTVASIDGARSATNGNTFLVPGITPTAASFTVTGEAGATFSISLPASLTLASGGNNMTVDTFESTPATPGTLTGGTQTVTVGGKVTVGGGQSPGLYTSAAGLNVIVNYN